MKKIILCLAIVSGGLASTRCTADEICDPGSTQSCECIDGSGVQTCVADGRAWGACGCGNGSPDADADMDTDTDTDIDVDTDADTDTATDSIEDTGTDAIACASSWGAFDDSTDLCWQRGRSTEEFNWQEAMDYCRGLTLGGHSDWELPSRKNLTDTLGGCDSEVMNGDDGYCDSCEASDNCTGLFGVDVQRFWSSSTWANSADTMWRVSFDIGYVESTNELDLGYGRCVRSGQ